MSAACRFVYLCLVGEHGKEIFKKYLTVFQDTGEGGSSIYNRSVGGVTKRVNLSFAIQVHKTIFAPRI